MISLILAVDKNWCIWRNNWLCWNLKKDLGFFYKKTINQVVIMWKNTYFSLPKHLRPLPDRINLIISTTFEDNNLKIFKKIDEAIKSVYELNKEIFFIWWKSIYEYWINYSDKIYLTQVYWKFDCDICLSDNFFNYLKLNFNLSKKWQILEEKWIKYRFLEYKRI